MLSRVADSLYWIGRYLERAENVARLVRVTSETSVELEGLDEGLAQAEWDELLEALGGAAGPPIDYSPEDGFALPYVRRLLLEDAIPVSVVHSLARARENARSVREAITHEVFTNLNEAYRDLQRVKRRGLRSPATVSEDLSHSHRLILTTLGSVEHTLTRDQGWTFMKLGEAIERTQRTLLILQSKLPALGLDSDHEVPLIYARWRGLLRCVASLENYRADHEPILRPRGVVQFLIFDATAPRAVLCGVTRVRAYLDHLPGGAGTSEADRILGRLHARLLYDDRDILESADLAKWCGETSAELAAADAAIVRQYFNG